MRATTTGSGSAGKTKVLLVALRDVIDDELLFGPSDGAHNGDDDNGGGNGGGGGSVGGGGRGGGRPTLRRGVSSSALDEDKAEERRANLKAAVDAPTSRAWTTPPSVGSWQLHSYGATTRPLVSGWQLRRSG